MVGLVDGEGSSSLDLSVRHYFISFTQCVCIRVCVCVCVCARACVCLGVWDDVGRIYFRLSWCRNSSPEKEGASPQEGVALRLESGCRWLLIFSSFFIIHLRSRREPWQTCQAQEVI